MANKRAETRVRPIIHDYIADLVKIGAYGKGPAGVIRRFIEGGIAHALETGVIAKRDIRDYGETIEDEGGDED